MAGFRGRVRSLFGLALAAAVLVLGDTGVVGGQAALISGTVLDVQGRPVAGVRVAMEADGTTHPDRYYLGEGARTGKDGRFRFRAPAGEFIPEEWWGTRVRDYTLSREVARLNLPAAERKWDDYGRCWLVADSPTHKSVGWERVAGLRQAAAVTIRLRPWSRVLGSGYAPGALPLSVAKAFPVGAPTAPTLARQFPGVPAAQIPRIVRQHDGHRVYLPPAMCKAAASIVPFSERNYDPEIIRHYPFSERQAPFAVVGDFDGDHHPDVLLDGTAGGRAVTLAVFTTGTGARAVNMGTGQAGARPLQAYWSLLPVRDASGRSHARVTSPYERKHTTMSGDGLVRTYWEKAATLYYYREGEFRQYAVGD